MPRALPILPALVVATALHAQGTVVRGVVRDAQGAPLGYATVELSPGGTRIFADDSGRFAFASVAPGAHELRARRLGHLPRDTALLVADAPLTIDVRLDRLTIALSEVRVVARRACGRGGPADADTALAAIFEQMRENADRWLLLAARYPFSERVERRVSYRASDGSGSRPGESDTLLIAAGARWKYAPGRVMSIEPGPNGPRQQMNLPSLPELADTTFLQAHCFSYGGLQKVRGTRYARVDFRPLDTLSAPDIDGSLYLDPEGYQLRRLEVRLTRPNAVDGSLKELRATTTFREILPSVVVFDTIEGTLTFWGAAPGSTNERAERQRMLEVVWLGYPPPGLARR